MKKTLLATLLAVLGAAPPATTATQALSAACKPTDFPLSQDDWQFSVSQDAPGQFSLFISAAAEGFLGTANFDSLAERFVAIDGIERVEQQDRESFVILSGSLSAQQLQSALWSSYENVAKQACGRG